MHNPIQAEAVELLLASISSKSDDGLGASFMFGKPGTSYRERRMGAEIYYKPKELTRAALFVRQQGPAYLKYLPIGDVWSMLQDFVSENFWYLADEVWPKRFDGTFAEHVSIGVKCQLADALAASQVFSPSQRIGTRACSG